MSRLILYSIYRSENYKKTIDHLKSLLIEDSQKITLDKNIF
jgi:hypothetical protein